MLLPEFYFENYKIIIEFKEYENEYYIYFDDMNSCICKINVDSLENEEINYFINNKKEFYSIIKAIIMLSIHKYIDFDQFDKLAKAFDFYDEDLSVYIKQKYSNDFSYSFCFYGNIENKFFKYIITLLRKQGEVVETKSVKIGKIDKTYYCALSFY